MPLPPQNLIRTLALMLMPAIAMAAPVGSGAPKAVIRAIDIHGARLTRESVILREIQLHAGDTILLADLGSRRTQALLRLVNLPVFTTVAVNWARDPTDSALILQIDLKERWPLIPAPVFQLADRNFNVWWYEMNRDLKRINLGLTLTHNNFRGNLEQLSVTAQAGYTQRLGVAYIRPYVDRAQRHGLGISAGIAQSAEIYYATDSNKLRFARLPGNHIFRQYDIAASWIYRPGYALRHSLTFGYHHADVSDTVLRLNPDYFGGGQNRIRYIDLSYRVDVNEVDNWNYPLRGFKSVNYLIVRKGLDGGFDWQAQLRTETGFYKPFPNRFYGSLILRGRLSVPGVQPYYFRSALGTRTDYVRGYEYYVVDGSSYALARMNLKYGVKPLVLRRLPFRYLPEIPLRFYPKVFFDAGGVRSPQPGNSFLHDRLLYAGGIGFDLVSSYDFKLRLEAAVNSLGQYGLYLHLNGE